MLGERARGYVRGVRSGFIDEATSVADVLQFILSRCDDGFAILNIRSTDGAIDGDLAIYRGIYVIGGSLCNPALGGWPAVKRLLEVREGEFNYMQCENRLPAGHVQGIKLRLTDLVSALPELPERPQQLVASRKTLTRLRAFTAGDQVNADSEPARSEYVPKSVFEFFATLGRHGD